MALLLRAVHLGFQSLWLDEAASFVLASQDLWHVVRNSFTIDPNPPAYYLLLHLWMGLFGASEVALRSLSVVAGVLYVPLLYLLGCRLYGRRVGFLAAVLATANPFLVWFSQEARAFSWLALFALAGAYCFVRALRDNRRGWWLAFGAIALLASYSHFHGALGLAVYPLFLLVTWPQHRPALRPCLVALGISLALYLPWLVSLPRIAAGWNWRGSYGLASMLWSLLSSFVFGETLAAGAYSLSPLSAVAVLVLVVIGLGLVFAGRRNDPGSRAGVPWADAFLLLFLATPIVGSFLISLHTPVFAPRYLIGVMAPMLLLLAAGLLRLSRVSLALSAVAGLVFLGAFAWILGVSYRTPLKEDFRAAAEYLRAHRRPGEATLFVAPYIDIGFAYYGIEGDPALHEVSGMAEAEAMLRPITDSHDAVWLVRSHDAYWDPQGWVRRWLEAHLRATSRTGFVGIEVLRFDGNAEDLPELREPVTGSM